MRSAWVVICGLLLSGISYGADGPTQAPTPAAQFQNILDSVIAHGTRAEQYNGTYMTLKEEVSKDQGVQRDYFSAVGSFDKSGVFTAGHVEVISEFWFQESGGNIDIDQWLYSCKNETACTLRAHVHIIEDSLGVVLVHEYLPTTDVQFDSQWQALLGQWAKRTEGKLF